ncbi:hypothetical protein LOTGIDRAFT_215219 [Lottia gigantea]|uniref:Nuclear transport factor 2 n=1 Tax=Lottia gigantea TaxID=225164 RepID=V4AN82_LOTGI|nr:hypothetical protein LOTGIDRAFT_215219 [Lottia gigantea]ESO95071.1 hypothetical protein LOTGIDRAFT_215219 [Lottia gigantea]
MNPKFKEIGGLFVGEYYKAFDAKNNRMNLKPFYHEAALLTFEGQEFQGPESILQKLMSIQSDNIERLISSADYQPTIDGGIFCTISGQLRTVSEHDKPMPFVHTFLLKPVGENFFVFNEVFRLALHDC